MRGMKNEMKLTEFIARVICVLLCFFPGQYVSSEKVVVTSQPLYCKRTDNLYLLYPILTSVTDYIYTVGGLQIYQGTFLFFVNSYENL